MRKQTLREELIKAVISSHPQRVALPSLGPFHREVSTEVTSDLMEVGYKVDIELRFRTYIVVPTVAEVEQAKVDFVEHFLRKTYGPIADRLKDIAYRVRALGPPGREASDEIGTLVDQMMKGELPC